jgi:hypothetical protein
MIKVRHVVYHWVALELGYPNKVLNPQYKLSPGTLWKKCPFLKKKRFFWICQNVKSSQA